MLFALPFAIKNLPGVRILTSKPCHFPAHEGRANNATYQHESCADKRRYRQAYATAIGYQHDSCMRLSDNLSYAHIVF